MLRLKAIKRNSKGDKILKGIEVLESLAKDGFKYQITYSTRWKKHCIYIMSKKFMNADFLELLVEVITYVGKAEGMLKEEDNETQL